MAGSKPSLRLVLLGAGHAHMLMLADLTRAAAPLGLRISLICGEWLTPYSGMIPGAIAHLYRRQEIFINVRALCRRLGVEFIEDDVVGIDPRLNLLRLRSRQSLAYDILSVNMGGEIAVAIADEGASMKPVKPVAAFLDWIDTWRMAEERVAVVGGGTAGVEIALTLDARLRQSNRRGGVYIVGRNPRLIPNLLALGVKAAKMLQKRNISFLLGNAAVAAGPGWLRMADGSTHPATRVVVATATRAWPVLAESGLDVDDCGFIRVNSRLQSVSHLNVFVCGDSASWRTGRLAKAGVYAVRQAPVLAANLIAKASGDRLTAWCGSGTALAILCDGQGGGLAHRGRLTSTGPLIWLWKDFLDRRFMRQFPVAPADPKNN